MPPRSVEVVAKLVDPGDDFELHDETRLNLGGEVSWNDHLIALMEASG